MIFFSYLHIGENLVFSINNKPGPFTFSLKHIELQSAKGIPQYKNQDIIMKGEFEYTVDRCKYGEKYWANGKKQNEHFSIDSFSKTFFIIDYPNSFILFSYTYLAGSKWRASSEIECVSKGFSFAAELSKISLSTSLNKAGGRSLLSMSTPNLGTRKSKSNDTLKNSMRGLTSEKRTNSPANNNNR